MANVVSPHCAAVSSFDCDLSGDGCGGCALVSQIMITNWNVEGLNDLKQEEIVNYMSRKDSRNNVDVCCLQETKKSISDTYELRGFSFILSGGKSGSNEWYGVGFVVPPRFKLRIRGFCQVSERIATLKISCSGGTFALITALAPHNYDLKVKSGSSTTNLGRFGRFCQPLLQMDRSYWLVILMLVLAKPALKRKMSLAHIVSELMHNTGLMCRTVTS